MVRAKRKNRPRPARGRRQSNWPVVMGALVAVLLLIGAFYLRVQTEKETAVDPKTLCPLATGPTAMTAILFDLTDPISPAQHKQLSEYIEREVDDAAIGTQFTLGTVSENPADWQASPPLCKPRAGKDVSSLTQNERLTQRRYEEKFLTPLRGKIQEMAAAAPSKRSPIMEALQALIADSPGFLTFTKGPRRLVIVSDLLQHSDVFSFYRNEDWRSFSASPAFQRLGRTLSDASVLVLQIPRTSKGIRRAEMVEDFWIRYFDLQGAQAPKVKRLGDL